MSDSTTESGPFGRDSGHPTLHIDCAMIPGMIDGRDRTAAARAARKRNHEERLALKLIERGWECIPPDHSGVVPPKRVCVACLAESGPFLFQDFDNHPHLGPICVRCVVTLVSPVAASNDRPQEAGQCRGCWCDHSLTWVGLAGFCGYCIAKLDRLLSERYPHVLVRP